jgi:hypothetical protein
MLFPYLLVRPGNAMLTNAHCKNATCPPDKKRARLTDGEDLYLETSPAGSKRWFAKIYRDGKKTRLALGRFRIPDDCIDSRRYPLFIARATMRALVQDLTHATAELP